MFPTPVRTSEIASSIKARAIGDPRVTTYYYTFEGQQGDVFINVQSKHFTGDQLGGDEDPAESGGSDQEAAGPH